MEQFNKICTSILKEVKEAKEKEISTTDPINIIEDNSGLDQFNKICAGILNEEGEPVDPTNIGDENQISYGEDPTGAENLKNELGSQDQPTPDPSEEQKALIDKFNKEIEDCIPSLEAVNTKLTKLFNLAVEYKGSNPEIFSGITEDIRTNTNKITSQIGSFKQILALTKSNIQDKFIDNKKETEKPKPVSKPNVNV
jgi:hypothetical protein